MRIGASRRYEMSQFKFNLEDLRVQFPALAKTVNGYPAAYLDGPGGTQVPVRVVNKINDYLYYHNANHEGAFATSRESDKLYSDARETYADFLNCMPDEIGFGANSSSNNLKLAFGILRTILNPGDEVLITDIDHEGNRSPWRTLEDFGIVVKSAAVDPKTCTLIMDDFAAKLSSKTKVVAVNWASNGCGTITDVKKCIGLAHEKGAITVIDAVHYAPHRWIDVKEIDTDVLICSAYKFFGPHLGIIYVKKELGEKLKTVRIMAYDNENMPWKLETGTPAFELACGAAEAVEFIADIGKGHEQYFKSELGSLSGRRRYIVAGMMAIDAYEEPIAKKLRTGLNKIEGVTVYGPPEDHPRTSTVTFAVTGVHANKVATYLGERGLFVWDGDYYAVQLINHVLDMEEMGGLVRVGLAPYNTEDEIERLIKAVQEFTECKP